MTKSEWDKVADNLNAIGRAKLLIDEYEVTLVNLIDVRENEVCIVPYINGSYKLEWLDSDCEIRARFFPVTYPNKLSKKKEEEMIKALGKSKAKNFMKEHEEIFNKTLYLPYWTSFAKLKRHFEKNNQSIQLL